MPKRCLDCPMYDCYNYNCQLYSFGIPVRYNIDGNTRPEWCELVEVPVPHGRLIDAETKIEAQYYDEEHEEWTMQTFTVEDIISIADNEVPTVIEAEDGG